MQARAIRPDDPRPWAQILEDLSTRWQETAPERKQDRSRRREAEILQAALRVFARQGIARARISDVAAEAGMPVSSIYEYHDSKEDLAYAVPVTHLGRFFVEYAEQALRTTSARERLRLYLRLSADFARRNPDWARVLYLEVWPSVLVAEARVRKGLDEYANLIVHLVRVGAAGGEWDHGPNPYETATILVGGFNQLLITWLMFRRPRDINRAAGALVDRMLDTLLPPLSGPAASTPATPRATVSRRRSRAVVATIPASPEREASRAKKRPIEPER